MSGASDADIDQARIARERILTLLNAGFWLTAVNFIACLGHFAYQLIMAKQLDAAEFTAFNTTLALVTLLGVPLAAASQAITHDLAWHHANDNQLELQSLQIACQKLLRRLTWILSIAALMFIHPLTTFFNFSRGSLALVALACVPITLWSLIGSVWCAGLSRFKLLAGLNFGTMVVRVAAGMVMVYFFPKAEAAVGATFVAGWVLASVVIFHRTPKEEKGLKSPWTKAFGIYLGASLLVGLGNFIYCFSDQLVAQRNIEGYALDAYVKAGLLARAVFWGSQPLLVVYFTQRSGKSHSTRGAIGLWLIYVVVVIIGVGMLLLLRKPLCHLLLRNAEEVTVLLPSMLSDLKRFSLVVLPVGILQGLGYYYLASEKLVESYLFGFVSLSYFAVLLVFGRSIEMLLSLMFGGAVISLLVMAIAAVIRYGRNHS
jgi:hypothetical protein